MSQLEAKRLIRGDALAQHVTPQAIVGERRKLLAAMWGLGAAAVPGAAFAFSGKPSPYSLLEKPVGFQAATSYNNFYEFGLDKADPARYAPSRLKTTPWSIAVEGLVAKPQVFDIDALVKMAPLEERIYRLRCVEGWSMVIPWVGFSFSELARRVQPLGSAKFVEFTTLADPQQMPGLSSRVLRWPYHEGLRLDEAMHPLSLLAFGMYGQRMPAQNGAPVRLVVPWKYGFKSIKSIVKIRFIETQPTTSWSLSAPHEYGFYSNVNPEVDHPRWSQASERVLGTDSLFAPRRKTEKFNGYEPLVGQLYTGMDLKRFY